MPKKRPTKLIGLLIYFLRIMLTRRLGPIWLRIVAAVLLGLLLGLEVFCSGFV